MPAFLKNHGQRIISQGRFQRPLHECDNLGLGETQILSPNLGDLMTRSHHAEGQLRLQPGGNHQVHTLR